jgi:hypothetical protein
MTLQEILDMGEDEFKSVCETEKLDRISLGPVSEGTEALEGKTVGLDAFKKEVLDSLKNYDRAKDFEVANGPEKKEVIKIIESLLRQMGEETSNVFRTERGALLCFPWDIMNFPQMKKEKWAVSFRGRDENFFLSLDRKGVLRGHLYSEKAEIHRTIKEFKKGKILLNSEIESGTAEIPGTFLNI